jgi:hypothetical protein
MQVLFLQAFAANGQRNNIKKSLKQKSLIAELLKTIAIK